MPGCCNVVLSVTCTPRFPAVTNQPSLLAHCYSISFNSFSLTVCIKFLTNFASSLTSDETSNDEKMQDKFMAACAKAKNKENRFVSKIFVLIFILV